MFSQSPAPTHTTTTTTCCAVVEVELHATPHVKLAHRATPLVTPPTRRATDPTPHATLSATPPTLTTHTRTLELRHRTTPAPPHTAASCAPHTARPTLPLAPALHYHLHTPLTAAPLATSSLSTARLSTCATHTHHEQGRLVQRELQPSHRLATSISSSLATFLQHHLPLHPRPASPPIAIHRPPPHTTTHTPAIPAARHPHIHLAIPSRSFLAVKTHRSYTTHHDQPAHEQPAESKLEEGWVPFGPFRGAGGRGLPLSQFPPFLTISLYRSSNISTPKHHIHL